MKRIIFFILIQSIIFLPFMPLLHAEESSTSIELQPIGESHCCSHRTNTHEHTIQDCIDIIHDILYQYGIVFPDVSKTIVPISNYQKEQDLGIDTIYSRYYPRSQDPPFFTGHSLVGIVKLTI